MVRTEGAWLSHGSRLKWGCICRRLGEGMTGRREPGARARWGRLYGGLGILAALGEEPWDNSAFRTSDFLEECHLLSSECECFPQDLWATQPCCSYRVPHFVTAQTLLLTPWGSQCHCHCGVKPRGGSRKGKLINSFHLQHFPHSIIFKLNKLSLGEKGKFPLSSALAGLTKPTLWGADGE